jgi:hypothetical protein
MKTSEIKVNVEVVAELADHIQTLNQFFQFVIDDVENERLDDSEILYAVTNAIETLIRKYEGFYADNGHSGYKYRLTH